MSVVYKDAFVNTARLAMVLGLLVGVSFADVSVNGYYRQDGTYVQPYTRTSPNSSTFDNYSSRPNYNPYTGNQGTVNPYQNTYSNPYQSAPSPYNYRRY